MYTVWKLLSSTTKNPTHSREVQLAFVEIGLGRGLFVVSRELWFWQTVRFVGIIFAHCTDQHYTASLLGCGSPLTDFRDLTVSDSAL